MDEGDTAMRVAVSGHFTPSIDETDDNTAGNENAVYFEDVHTGLLSCEYAPGDTRHRGNTGDR